MKIPLVKCNICKDFVTSCCDREDKHIIGHSIESIKCSNKTKDILKILLVYTNWSSNDFELFTPIISKIVDGVEVQMDFVECMNLIPEPQAA